MIKLNAKVHLQVVNLTASKALDLSIESALSPFQSGKMNQTKDVVEFKVTDPFPLFKWGIASLNEECGHSTLVDEWLGFEIPKIEAKIATSGCHFPKRNESREQRVWLGLDPAQLQTPYTEIRRLLSDLSPLPGSHVVDLGAAYGRMGFVLERHHPGVQFTGIEVVGERVSEARRVYKKAGLSRSEMMHADLSDRSFKIPPASHYFLYDFGNDDAIERCLHVIRSFSSRSSVTVTVRGRRGYEMITRRHPWLKQREKSSTALYTVQFCSVGETVQLATSI